MSSRVTLKAVNRELARLGHDVLLAKGSGYFYFWTGEAADWLDRTVNVPSLSALTLDRWVQEFCRLQKLNRKILDQPATSAPAKKKIS